MYMYMYVHVRPFYYQKCGTVVQINDAKINVLL